jgi:subfamily B ATP-binding cassette protein MsbA
MKNYLRFIKLLIPHSGRFALAVACMLFSTLFTASPVAMIVPLIDIVVTGKKINIPENINIPALTALVDRVNSMPPLLLLNSMALLVVVFFLLRSVFTFLEQYLMSDVSQRVIRDVKQSIYRKLQSLSMDFYSSNPTGQLMSRITHDAAVIRDAIGSGVADTFKQPIELVVYTCMVIGLKIIGGIPWKLILSAAVIFPLILLPVIRIGKRLRQISKRSQEKIGDINNMLLETIVGIKVVKSFCMEDYEQKHFRENNDYFYRLRMKAVKRMKIVSPMTEFMAIICVAIILWIAGKSIISGELSTGMMTAFMAAIFSMMKPIKKLSNVYGINQQALAASDRIFDLLDTPVSIQEKPGAVSLTGFNKAIDIRNISFSYDTEPVLRGVDLTIRKGDIVALVGPSGAGKSTLANLIPRFYDPTSGSVTIDGTDLRDVSIRSLREKIGLVTQETFLFNDTIRNNITYGHEEADEDQLRAVARAANIENFINALPEGYNTVTGERGVRISGGQRQRFAIARAIYKNPPILIFDEATSQLDTENEKLVQDAINNLMQGRTVIVIAHRLSTITHADKIVVMQDGRIVDTGTHEQLLETSALYTKLYKMQFTSSGPARPKK